ncbi:MAG TPA: hypothetical protein VGJ44_28815 [Kribbellaceae bacterium]|jgi:hypothetical protein
MRSGRRIRPARPPDVAVADARHRLLADLATLPEAVLRTRDPDTLTPDLSPALARLTTERTTLLQATAAATGQVTRQNT